MNLLYWFFCFTVSLLHSMFQCYRRKKIVNWLNECLFSSLNETLQMSWAAGWGIELSFVVLCSWWQRQRICLFGECVSSCLLSTAAAAATTDGDSILTNAQYSVNEFAECHVFSCHSSERVLFRLTFFSPFFRLSHISSDLFSWWDSQRCVMWCLKCWVKGCI